MIHRTQAARTFRICLVLVALGSLLPELSAQTNPFFSPPSGAQSGEVDAAEGGPTGRAQSFSSGSQGRLFPAFSAWITRLQRSANERVTGYIQTLVEEEGRRGAVLPIFGAAFLYGLLHAFLPGHRKTVILSYYLSEDARLSHGLLAGLLFAVMHASSAVVIILGVSFLTQGAIAGTAIRAGEQVQIVSSGLIMLLGAAFLAYKVRHAQLHRRRGIEARTTDGLGFNASQREALPPRIPAERFFPLVVVSGMVPCPGTTLLLLFTLSLGLVEIGAIAVVAMSAGLAVALSSFAVATILFKQHVVGLLENRLGYGVHLVVELFGASFIFLFGLVTLLAYM